MPLLCSKLLLEFNPQILSQFGLVKQCSSGARLLSTLCGSSCQRDALTVPLWVQLRKCLPHGTNIKLLLKLLYVRSEIFTFARIFTLSSLTALPPPPPPFPDIDIRAPVLSASSAAYLLIGLFVVSLFLLQPVLDARLTLLKHRSGAAALH